MSTSSNNPTELPVSLITQSVTSQNPPAQEQLCPSAKEHAAQLAINLIHGKWKIGILCGLQQGLIRLSQLRKAMPDASMKMLTQQLREMEKDRLIVRTDLSNRLRHVEYSLSKRHGIEALRLIDMLSTWGSNYQSREAISFQKTNEEPSADL